MNNQKMSKSLGNVIDPISSIQKYTKDGLRYFLLREGVPAHDSNITESKIITLLNAELANTLGNLFQRSLSKSINPLKEYPTYKDLNFNSRDKEFIQQLDILAHECDSLFNQFSFYDGLQKIMSRLRDANLYFDEKKPWILAKQADCQDSQLELKKTFYLVFETIRITAILLQPIIPNIAESLLDSLNVPLNERFIDNAKFDTNKITTSHVAHRNTIFKRIELKK